MNENTESAEAAVPGGAKKPSFEDLGLSAEVLRAVADLGFAEPTPIQTLAIPHILFGRDVLGRAQTGTGKTGAFALPMIDILSAGRARARMPRALVLAPTRELATQIAESFTAFGKHHPLIMALLIGGVSMEDQEKKLDRGVDVLIATPGRLLDHFERGGLILHGVKVLVIDEADRMLDMGFIPDVERILKLLPPIRQTLLFSATIPREVRRLADSFMTNPKEVSVTPRAAPAEGVDHSLVALAQGDPKSKRAALRRLLREQNITEALIFCNRKRDVDMLRKSLDRHGFEQVGALHGDMAQSGRTATLEAFKEGHIKLLVASDVAGRGLDISELPCVINFDVPHHSEDYIHRIGRTGRAGRKGRAFTLLTRADAKALAAIERLLGQPIPRLGGASAEPAGADEGSEKEAVPEIAPAKEAPGGRRRRRGKRGEAPSQKTASAPAAKPPANPPVSPPVSPPGASPNARRSERPAQAEKKPELGERIVGFGEHMPAFLARPSRRG